jgi:hypothetical protein
MKIKNTKKTATKNTKRDYQRDYLEVRKKRYREDAEHAGKIKLRERENNRQRRIDAGKPVVEKSYGCYAGQASSFSSSYKLEGKKVQGLNIKQMAGFLCMSESGLRTWIRRDVFPPPSAPAGGNVRIYRLQIANKLASLILNGLDGFATMRADTHEDLINELHAATE